MRSARSIIEAETSGPPTLRGAAASRLTPNTIYVWGNDWSGGRARPSVESFPYAGDLLTALRDARMERLAAHVILATDATGRPWRVISPNLRHVADYGTPEADYIAGDVHAPARDLRRRIQAAATAGDYPAAERLLAGKVKELEKTAGDYGSYIRREEDEDKRDRAALRAGARARDLDPRFDDPDDYFEQRRRRVDSFRHNREEILAEIESWRALMPRRV